uniref:Reverse transcriptase zinc-binding domain-containing protein n=1 Tax=Physcomitrium patens TaxID=3218 RepID=A0A2K1IEA0_PHYPA|nr:hypothetical protein PHYPA_029755 [Physcomitrium patens]
MWMGRITQTVAIQCPVCPRRAEKSVLHRFWESSSAQRAWQWGIHLLNLLIHGMDTSGPWQPLSWRQGLFSDRIPRKLKKYSMLWTLIRSVVLWTV